jgi:hypothetical protein
MKIRFSGEVLWWKGPAPFVFVAIPEEAAAEIRTLSRELSYGWGVIPVQVTLGSTVWTTSLFPKDGRYLVPVKKFVQTAESVTVGQVLELDVDFGRG